MNESIVTQSLHSVLRALLTVNTISISSYVLKLKGTPITFLRQYWIVNVFSEGGTGVTTYRYNYSRKNNLLKAIR